MLYCPCWGYTQGLGRVPAALQPYGVPKGRRRARAFPGPHPGHHHRQLEIVGERIVTTASWRPGPTFLVTGGRPTPATFATSCFPLHAEREANPGGHAHKVDSHPEGMVTGAV
ncbi:hypothetical protein LCGC14_0692890 [marine sediment metagenome]|uniref:Uncharacterized protein n=1 Tax=marine sediment metagenome TaxID=412755 RepID=A0A0F9TSV0_9ZZZZ